MDFLIGSLAGMGAALFTNPIEVVKIRMQLQGELKSRGHHAVHYKNFFNAFYVIAKHDGIASLQSGLIPAQFFQFTYNGIRLGSYQILTNKGFVKDENGKIIFYKIILCSGITGIFGTIVASPLFLVKIHLQAQATKEIAFGHQHNHAGMWEALTTIYKEHGVKGLYRGTSASIPRVFVGSMAQLTAFDFCKQWLNKYSVFPNSAFLTTLVGSLMAGPAACVCSTPFDLMATRLYNQGVDASGKGLLYHNYLDCALKIWKAEGFFGFYKGLGSNMLRAGPHTMLCFVFWDQLKSLNNKRKNK